MNDLASEIPAGGVAGADPAAAPDAAAADLGQRVRVGRGGGTGGSSDGVHRDADDQNRPSAAIVPPPAGPGSRRRRLHYFCRLPGHRANSQIASTTAGRLPYEELHRHGPDQGLRLAAGLTWGFYVVAGARFELARLSRRFYRGLAGRRPSPAGAGRRFRPAARSTGRGYRGQ
jgi:hypothetical protein